MNVRRLALQALIDVTDGGAYANLRLKALPDALNAHQRRRISALVYTALDHLLYLDWLLAHFVSGRQKSVVRGILRLGAAELLYFHTPAHAVVSEYVSLTRAVGKAPLSGFVNATLRSVERSKANPPPLPDAPVERLSLQFSYPAWLVSEWVSLYGADFAAALLAADPAGMGVRAQFPFTTAELLAALPVAAVAGKHDENCLLLQDGFDVTALPEYVSGQMSVQGQGAMLACRALLPCAGMRVLDACAAPGGKSAYLASLCFGNVHITAMELHPHRVELMERTFARLHVQAETLCHDATQPIPAFFEAFDAVLLDAPCSGLGLLHDKPDIRYAKTDADVTALAALQRTLLAVCCDCVKPGGVIVYATCTISRRENEDNVRAFLAEQTRFVLESMPIPIENDGMLQLFPNVHGTEGFFLARMRKCS